MKAIKEHEGSLLVIREQERIQTISEGSNKIKSVTTSESHEKKARTWYDIKTNRIRNGPVIQFGPVDVGRLQAPHNDALVITE